MVVAIAAMLAQLLGEMAEVDYCGRTAGVGVVL